MKATRAGQSLGKALEPWTPNSDKATIMAFVNNTYYAGSFSNFGLSVSGNVQTSSELLSSFTNNLASTSNNQSDLTVDRLTASQEIITPKITTLDITANTIFATTVTSPTLDVITNRISDLESAIASSSNVTVLNSRVTALENKVSNHFDTPNYSFAVDGNVSLTSLPLSSTTESALCLSLDGDVSVNRGISNCVIGTSSTNVTDVASSTTGLDLVRLLKPVKFKYNGQSNEHFGFISDDVDILAPELVAHSASGTPLAVRYDELTSVLAKSIQELDMKITDIDTRLTNLEAMVGSSTSQTSTSGLTFVEIISEFTSQFETVGAKFESGMSYFKNVFADTFTIGSSTKPAGITIYDDVTNAPYCLKMRNGEMISLAGTCESLATTTPETATSTPEADTTLPVISIFGNNPAEISYGTSYMDLGASVTDMDENGTVNNNLGLHFNVDGVDMLDVYIDTSVSTTSPMATTTHTIIYSAVDSSGNWGYATRTVEIIP